MKTAMVSLLLVLGFNMAHAGTVDISTSPTTPIVFTNDFSTTDPDGNTTVVKGPWFSMTVNINNHDADILTIIGLHVEVTGADASGNPVTVVQDILPSQFNYSTTNVTCNYADFGSFDPNGTPTGPVFNNTGLFSMPTSNSSTSCYRGTLTFFISGNPAVQNTSLIEYSVKIRPIGYFGAATSPKSRFDDFITIKTQ
jgi:hypothetical protein